MDSGENNLADDVTAEFEKRNFDIVEEIKSLEQQVNTISHELEQLQANEV